MIEFVGFPKIARLNRDIIITEKIDGTNGCVVITEDGEIAAQSRKRIVTPDDDNFGFAAWVYDNRDSLIADLGPGRHYGEWFGNKIQRGYGLKERYFALFNTSRWSEADLTTPHLRVVPVLYEGLYDDREIRWALRMLSDLGSYVGGANWDSEGIVIYHTAAKTAFKVTLKDDEVPKSVALKEVAA